MNVRHEPGDHGGQFVLEDAGVHVGELTYTRAGTLLMIHHTGVDPAYEGRGLGKRLVSEAVAYARTQGFKVQASCWFARGLLEKVPAFADVQPDR